MNSVTPQNSIYNGYDVPTTVAVFHSEKDNIPRSETGTLGDLFGDKHIVRDAKAGSACYSPTIYREGAKRGNAGVAWLTGIVLDYDHRSVEEVQKVYQWVSGYAAAMHSSFSDMSGGPTDRCARVFLPVSRWVTPEDGKLLWSEVVSRIGVPVDEHASDPARVWYLPSCPEARISTAFITYTAGPILDPDPLIAVARTSASLQKHTAKTAEGWRDLVAGGAEKGERHGAMVKLAAHLIAKGVDPYVVLDLVRAWNLAKCSPPKPDSEVVAIVNYLAGQELTRKLKGGRRG